MTPHVRNPESLLNPAKSINRIDFSTCKIDLARFRRRDSSLPPSPLTSGSPPLTSRDSYWSPAPHGSPGSSAADAHVLASAQTVVSSGEAGELFLCPLD